MNSNDFIDSFFDKNINFNSPIAKVKQCIDEDYEEFDGNATLLFQNKKLYLSFFPSNENLHSKTFTFFDWEKPGNIIPDKKYYILEITDKYGKKWYTNRFIPQKKFYQNNNKIMWNGEVTQLWFEEFDESYQDNKIILYYNDAKFKIPYNHAVDTEIRRFGKINEPDKSYEWSFCDHKSKFLISHYKNGFEIILESNTIIDELAEKKINAAFSFIIGTEIKPDLVIRYAKCKKHFRLYNNTKTISSKMYPPINLNYSENDTDYGDLFLAFYNFINTNKTNIPFLHSSLILSKSINIESFSLLLSITIENIIKENYDLSNIKITNQIDDLLIVIKEQKLDDCLYKRIEGSLNQIRNSPKRIDDFLKELVDNNIIELKLKNSWKKVRNSVAHGEFSGKIENKLRHSFNVLTLYYIVVFHTIKYYGYYTDYSSEYWELKKMTGNGV